MAPTALIMRLLFLYIVPAAVSLLWDDFCINVMDISWVLSFTYPDIIITEQEVALKLILRFGLSRYSFPPLHLISQF